MWRLAWLLILLVPAPAQDELMLKWNRFAQDGNALVQSVDANKEHRARLKRKWREEFEAVYPLL